MLSTITVNRVDDVGVQIVYGNNLNKGPMACEDVEGVSGEVNRAWISVPRVGKHVCFDGRYLHAAPSDLAPSTLHAPNAAGVAAGGGVSVESDLGR